MYSLDYTWILLIIKPNYLVWNSSAPCHRVVRDGLWMASTPQPMFRERVDWSWLIKEVVGWSGCRQIGSRSLKPRVPQQMLITMALTWSAQRSKWGFAMANHRQTKVLSRPVVLNQMVANGFSLLARALGCAIHCGAQVSASWECRKCDCHNRLCLMAIASHD